MDDSDRESIEGWSSECSESWSSLCSGCGSDWSECQDDGESSECSENSAADEPNSVADEQGGAVEMHESEQQQVSEQNREGDANNTEVSESIEPEEEELQKEYGCPHYKRKCLLLAPCCDQWFACRVCHDLEVQDGHTMNRHLVKELKCLVCGTRQEVKAECQECGARFGKYHCDICNLFDDMGEKKKIFHCDECGICRVGGRENFFHCKKCGSCYSVDLRDNHQCIEGSMKQDCPVCLEYLFSSREVVNVLTCGHVIHRKCFAKLLKTDYTCPICRKSVRDMSRHFQLLREEIAETPMPVEYREKEVNILCNDCHKTSKVKFHVLGLECGFCNSFNTGMD